MKVYCYNCGHVRSSSDCFGGVYVDCAKTPVLSVSDTPVCKRMTYDKLEEMNKDNNCRLYQKRKWWQMLWANTNG